jgi:hypothetical protein
MNRISKVFIHGIAIAILLVFVAWTAQENISTEKIPDYQDASSYVRMAYHLYHHGIVSESLSEPPTPGNRREPGFSAYLAMMMHFSPKLQMVPLAQMTEAEGGAVILRKLQIPLLVLLAIGVWILAFVLTGRLTISYLAMGLMGFSQASLFTMNSLFRELFMGVVLLIVALVLVYAIRTRKAAVFAGLGLALGGLVLTNAVYQYFIIVLVGYVLYLFKRGTFEKKQMLVCLGLLILGYAIPTGAWMTRNFRQFGRFYITDRAGDVMAIRAEFNKMTADEYWGAFLWWTPDPLCQKKATKVMQEERRWIKLPGGNPEGYYAVAKALTNFLEPGEKFENPSQRDKAIQKRAMGELMRHPFRHLATTLPFAWRGMFFEHGYMVSTPFTIMIRSTVLISLLYFGCLFFWTIYSYRRQQWEVFGIVLLCMYLFGLNSLISHNIPRYNQPILPLLVVLFAMSVYHFFSRSAGVKGKFEVKKH